VQRIEVTQDSALPVGRLYAFLSEHENLGPLLGAKVIRVRDGLTDRNGAGSVRRFHLGPLPAFEETVTAVVPDEMIEYRISKGSPLRDHRGVLRFAPKGTGSTVTWTITFSAPPVLDRVVALGLRFAVRRGLATVDRRA
jgi:Polyketide cyclase / dehydrase and lipid transport